jgi:hypothetical protein
MKKVEETKMRNVRAGDFKDGKSKPPIFWS